MDPPAQRRCASGRPLLAFPFVAIGLIVAAVALGSSGSSGPTPATAATGDSPRSTVRHLCALRLPSLALLRRVDRRSDCRDRERAISLEGRNPVVACAPRIGGPLRRVGKARACRDRERALTLGGARPVLLCASRSSGRLRFPGRDCPPRRLVIVPSGNRAPVARGLAATTREDEPKQIVLSASDRDGDRLTFSIARAPRHGRLSGTGSNRTYTPDAEFNGRDSFTFRAHDRRARSNLATASVSVRPVNDPPSARDGTARMEEDGAPIEIDFGDLVADRETPESGLSYEVLLGPSAAQGALTGTGSRRSFDSAPGFSGTFDILYRVRDRGDPTGCGVLREGCDGPQTSETRKVSVTVASVNEAPVLSLTGGPAGPVEEGATEHSYAFGVTDGDAGDDFSPKSGFPDCGTSGELVPGSLATGTTGGTFKCRFGDGPANPTVRMQVSDGEDDSNVASSDVTVSNAAPQASLAAPASVNEGEDADLALSATDPAGSADTLEYRFRCGSADWTAFGSDSTHSCPTSDDGPLAVRGQVRDEDGGESPEYERTVSVANLAPSLTAPNDQTSAEGELKAFALGSFSDPGDDGPWQVTIDWGDGSAPEVFAAASPGALGEKSHAYAADGAHTVSVTVAEDGASTPADTATFSVTTANVAPTAAAGSLSTDEDTPATAVLAGADAGSDPLTFELTSLPAHGKLFEDRGSGLEEITAADLPHATFSSNLVYAPDADYAGPDAFDYRASDGAATSDAATVSIGVDAVNDAPTLVAPASISVAEDTASALTGIYADDVDAGSSEVSIALSVPSGTLAATSADGVTVAGSGTGELTLTGTLADLKAFIAASEVDYTTARDATNDVALTATVDDQGHSGAGGARSDSETVTLDVAAVNDAPTLTMPSGFTADEDVATALTGLSAADPDAGSGSTTLTVSVPSGTLTATSGAGVTAGGSGTGSLALTGTIADLNAFVAASKVSFKTAQDATDDVELTATIDDGGNTGSGGALSDSEAATIDVRPVNDAPTADAESFSGAVGNTRLAVGRTISGEPHTSIAGDVLAGDSDIEGDQISITTGTIPSTSGGSVEMGSDGTFTYLPGAGFNGTDSFRYEVCDDGSSGEPASSDSKCGQGTVEIGVQNMVWYVKNNAAAGGDGRSTEPFDTLAEAQTASGANHTIFVHKGDGTSSGQNSGIALKNGQRLLGQGVDLTVGSQTLLTGASADRPAVGNSGGDGVRITANTASGPRTGIEARGLKLSASGNALDATSADGASLGLTVSDNTITAAGAEGIDVNLGSTATATLALHDNAITSTGTALDLQRTAGTAYITRFDDNTVSGDTAGSGIVVGGGAGAGVTFDSAPGGAANAVSAGQTAIGSSVNPVAGAGMTLNNVTGPLSFSDLDVYAGAGAGLLVGGTGTSNTNVGVTNSQSNVEASSGPALDATLTTVNLPLNSLRSSNSSSTGVSLNGVAGSLSAESGSSITNAATTDFDVTAGTANVTYKGTITDDVGRLVSVANATGGTKSFQGPISDGDDGDGGGVSLVNNSGATTRFAGGLTLSTGANPAFAATGGGAVKVSGASNKLTTTTATALNVANTDIGASEPGEGGLNFRSISAGGGANGILLDNTGNAGGLNVTGTGTTAGSGGTIQNTTSHAVGLRRTGGHSFNLMRVSNPGGSGFDARELSGDNFIRKSTIEGFNNSNTAAIWAENNSTNGGGLTLDASTVQNQTGSNGSSAVIARVHGGVEMDFRVLDSDLTDAYTSRFTNLFGSALNVAAGELNSTYPARLNFEASNSDFVDAASNGLNNLEMTALGSAQVVPTVSSNRFDKVGLPLATVGVINLNTQDSGRVSSDSAPARITNNTITNIRSGPGPTFAYDPTGTNGYVGMRFAIENSVGGVNQKLQIEGNTVTDLARQALIVSSRGNANDVNVRVAENTFGTQAKPVGTPSARRGVEIETQSSSTMKLDLANNPSIVGGTSSSNSAVHLRSGVTSGASSNLQATVVGNTIGNPNTGTTNGRFKAETISIGAGSMCLDLRNNALEDGSKVFELSHASTGTFRRNQGGNTGALSETGTMTPVGSCSLPGF